MKLFSELRYTFLGDRESKILSQNMPGINGIYIGKRPQRLFGLVCIRKRPSGVRASLSTWGRHKTAIKLPQLVLASVVDSRRPLSDIIKDRQTNGQFTPSAPQNAVLPACRLPLRRVELTVLLRDTQVFVLTLMITAILHGRPFVNSDL